MEIECENKCGNLTVEGRNICYDCIEVENDFSQNPERQLGRELTVEEKERMRNDRR